MEQRIEVLKKNLIDDVKKLHHNFNVLECLKKM